MFEYMDDISEVVYVADTETYELLYLNDSAKRLAGVDSIEGHTCYAALQGADKPCPFCTNDSLSFDKNYTWEHVNPLTGHRYLLKDRLIEWEGHSARLEVAFDMTVSKTSEIDLRNTLDIEGMVLQCARELYELRDMEVAVRSMLRRLGSFLSADSVDFFRIAGEKVLKTCSWQPSSFKECIDGLPDVDEGLIARWRHVFERNECVIIENVESLAPVHPEEYAFLTARGVSTLVAVPLERQDKVVGFIIIENLTRGLVRNIAPSLRTLCYFLMTTIARIENEQKLAELSFHDSLTGLSNRNRYLDDLEVLAQSKESLGIVFLDINDLKLVNDRFGHSRGDEMLCACADKMRAMLDGANLYRIGGDEFVAVACGVSEDDFYRMVNELDHAFDCDWEGVQGNGGDKDRYVALGAQWAEDSSNVQGVLAAADARMYKAKQSFHIDHALGGVNPSGADETLNSPYPPRVDQSALLREYNMLMSAMHVSVSKHLMTDKFEVVWANDYYYEMTGYTREEYVTIFNNNCADYFADFPEVFAQLSDAIMDAVSAGEPGYSLSLQMPQKGGSRLWINVVGVFTNEEVNGVPVIYVTFTDVNDIVQMEQERSVTYENLPGFVGRFQVSAEGLKILWGNERFEEFFGVVGKDATQQLFSRNIESNKEAIQSHYGALRKGEPASFEARALGCAGQEAYFTVIANCIDWKNDDPIYLVLYLNTTEIIEQQRRTEEANAQLGRLAFVDPVTEGRNRVRFDLDAGAAVQAAPPNSYALVSLDIQKFKVVNDWFGIEQGNKVLKYVYEQFASFLEPDEYVARITADLFNLIIKVRPQKELEARLESMARAVNDFADLDGGRAYVLTMTAGIYVIDDPQSPMIQMRDLSNVARKEIGKMVAAGRLCECQFYSNKDRLRLAAEKELENRMRGALDAGEFTIYLQPKFDLQEHAVAGAEALVRWIDPVKGVILPNDFIPLFEKNGFVVDLDLNVFEQVCTLLRRWIDAGRRMFPISVNMSRAHLDDPCFLDRYEDIRKRYDVPASLIEIEFTETLVFEDPDRLEQIIDHIHETGYACSMDDFGSGYSSLNVLKDLRVDTLKLDRVFFDAPDFASGRGADIIGITLEMARRLNMKTVAEGVETDEQAAFLTNAGCDMIQGYLFSRPVPPDEFERLAFGDESDESDESGPKAARKIIRDRCEKRTVK